MWHSLMKNEIIRTLRHGNIFLIQFHLLFCIANTCTCYKIQKVPKALLCLSFCSPPGRVTGAVAALPQAPPPPALHRDGCHVLVDCQHFKTKFILKHLRFTDTVLLTHLKTA